MRIASDVLGTIRGPKGRVIVEALRRLIAQGHDVKVWSSDYGMALDAVHEHGLGVEALSKFSKYEAKNEDRELFDVALEDDHMQRSYLGAKRFIMVDEITTVDALVANILTPPPSQNESAGE